MGPQAYDRWNKWLVEHFFNPGRAGQIVRLNVTGDLLDALGRPHGLTHQDFLAACREGSGAIPKRDGDLCAYALRLARSTAEYHWNHPGYIGYLGLFVYLETVEAGDETSFHRRLWAFSPARRQRHVPTFYPHFGEMRRLWEKLAHWTTIYHEGRWGNFRVLRLGGYTQLGIVRAQSVLTERERRSLPHLFYAAGLTPDSPVTQERMRQVVSDGAALVSHRTLQAFQSEDHARFLIDDLREDLRNWDGLPPESNGEQEIGTVVSGGIARRQQAELVLFFEGSDEDRVARLRFEEREAVPGTRTYRSEAESELLIGTAQGWSAPARTGAGVLDASRLDWSADHAWRSEDASGPRRLLLPGRSQRIFADASALGLGGLVEKEELPAAGRCFLAAGPDSQAGVEAWLGRLPEATWSKKAPHGLPGGWRLYFLKRTPTDQAIRDAFPGEAQSREVRLHLRGGLRVGRGGSRVYHTFAAPRIELAGDGNGVTVTANGVALVPLDAAVFEFPLAQTAGEVVIRAARGGEVLAVERLELRDVAHAGSPAAVRSLLDGAGRATEAGTGWAGAWTSPAAVPPFPFEKPAVEAAHAPERAVIPSRPRWLPQQVAVNDKLARRLKRKKVRLALERAGHRRPNEEEACLTSC